MVNKALSKSTPTDNDVILGIVNNSDQALERLYKAYFPMVLQLVINNSGSEDDAKDVYQETILVLYNKVKAGGFELSSKLKTFIYSVARRLWLKKLNQSSRSVVHLQDYHEYVQADEELEDHRQQDHQFSHMYRALNQMGEPCRTIIEDFYILNRSMQDICDKFGYTNTDNAKTQKYKCLQRLKKLFFSINGDQDE